MEHLLLIENHPEKIQVRNDNLTYSNDKEWSNLMASFSTKIDSFSTDEFKNLIVQEFSTTTPTISAVYRATHMDITSHYVGFESHTMCGFPSITLLGTPDDWRKIYDQVDAFSDFGLEEWVQELKPVLNEFVLVSEGNPNVDFWKSFYKNVTVYDTQVISGWILKFYPYLRKTRMGDDSFEPNPYLKGSDYLLSDIGEDNLSKGYKECEIEWIVGQDSSIRETLLLYSGFYGILQNEETGAVQPNITWILTSSETNSGVTRDYSVFRQKSKRMGEEPRVIWSPGLAIEAEVKPVYQPDVHSSFEESVQVIGQKLRRNILFGDDDHPKINLLIGYDGSVWVKSTEGATEKQEEYIREFIESTSGEWSPTRREDHEISGPLTIPTNFEFVLTL